MVQLDSMTGGRAILGTGPGALPSDAKMLGIDPIVLRDRQDEALGVIRRLLAGERFSYESDWFNLVDARLQMLPLQAEMPMAVASMVSPSGPELAGKHGVGLFSIGSMSPAGITAMPLQWSFVEQAAPNTARPPIAAAGGCWRTGILRRPVRSPAARPWPGCIAGTTSTR